MSAGSLLAAGLWPGTLGAGESDTDDFHFLVLNDTHWQGKFGTADWFGALAKQMKSHEEKPELVLLAGDLSDDGTHAQLEGIREFCKSLGLRVYVVPGNHDYSDDMGRDPYEELFPDRINYRFEQRGWQFLGFDSTMGKLHKDTAIQRATLQWLDATLPKIDRKRPTIAFTHFPLGPKVHWAPNNAWEVLERFKEHNLRAVFCGHRHEETERQVGELVLTTNRCCAHTTPNHDGSRQKGYYLCRAKAGQVTRTFVGYGPG
jgi:3',5'-cyclic AMP phosphodiesterase CpdA